MASIDWCKKQAKGIRFTKPNDIISKDYFRKADEALSVLVTSPSEEWRAIAAYYACYDAVYALFQKVGIVCEIHDCTLELMSFFGFSGDEIKFIKDLKIQRINAQYYIDRDFEVSKEEDIKNFVLCCKKKAEEIDFEGISNKIKES
jgi:uncharacterized protein (UPF0332 family)